MAEQITIEEFKKVEIKVGEVLSCKRVEGTDKLYQMEISLGDEKRTCVAGIAKYYSENELIGKKIPVVVNLYPVKIRGIMSSAMILAAQEGEKLSIVVMDKDISAGTKVL